MKSRLFDDPSHGRMAATSRSLPQPQATESAMSRSRNDRSPLTRRRFVQQAALAGAALAAPAFVSARSPNEKLNVVLIGCGGRGASNLQEMLGENIVALCDVSEPNLLAAGAKAPRARKFRDFRKLY